MTTTESPDALREQVREHYAAAARAVTDQLEAGPSAAQQPTASCCGDGCCGGSARDEQLVAVDAFGPANYEQEDRAAVPAAALAASLGCGNPTAVADLRPGERVLDLGSGGGIDVILSARRVGPTGKAYGVDMTDDMLALARRNAETAGVGNVEFLRGTIEDVPLPAGSVDVVISNCVVNLSTDKPAVFREMARVLRPGGRLGVSDVVAEDRLSAAERAERGGFVGCVAGALSIQEYESGLRAAGFRDVTVELTHEVADGIHNALVKARLGD